MTVAELIAQLQSMPQDAKVVVWDSDFDWVQVTHVEDRGDVPMERGEWLRAIELEWREP